ncbi:hypothetical protein BGZ76_005292 [Entomortierella beljakovae]|nr:hypothetical protein BGZ76_005292 [Entomortierella beljakovae]
MVFPHLQKLFLQGSSRSKFPVPTDFISNNPTIEEIKIQDQIIHNHSEFLDTLSNLPNLKRVDISGYQLPQELVGSFWSVFCQLESVTLRDFKIPTNLLDQPGVPNKLKHLYYSSLIEKNSPLQEQHDMFLIEKCTGLEHIFYSGVCLSTRIIVDNFAKSHWPNLHNIQLCSVELDNIQVQNILESIARLTALRLDRAEWGLESFNALSRHFGTLEILDTWLEDRFTSVMVNTVMCSCPNLKKLSGTVISGLDIVNNNQIDITHQHSQGWICNRLADLAIDFDLRGVISQTPIMERISSLTRLARWDMHRGYIEYPQISLSLHSGLDMLKSLKDLEKVVLKGFSHTMEEADIRWIIKNWKSLRYLNGSVHRDSILCDKLRKMLALNKIMAGDANIVERISFSN